jgi:hypothetical protein
MGATQSFKVGRKRSCLDWPSEPWLRVVIILVSRLDHVPGIVEAYPIAAAMLDDN